MKKRTIVILLIVIALLIGGGVIVWKWKPKEGTKNSDNSPAKTPLNQLNDKELEKCLLEDFSRRLELEKYFVFSLGELKKGNVGVAGLSANNIRANTDTLAKHLTILASKFDKSNKLEKKFVRLLDSSGDKVMPEYSGEKLDEKIEKDGSTCIIFDKDNDADYKGAMPSFGYDETGAVGIKIKEQNILKSKSEALEFLKNNDPALAGKN